ncbi:hypothetical protein ACFX5Z_07720 [Aeromonas dhakensis]|uniref:hypothetical protein n=1 Tax=Aeromonas TaxID=642 RepID=UPI00370D6E72
MDITTITTITSVLVAIAAAWFSWLSAVAWKESNLHNIRCAAVSAWVGMAATFRLRLKFVYKQKLQWPEDKKEIELIAEHFLSWVALWPSVRDSLDGDLKIQAIALWNDVHIAHSALMNTNCTVEQFGTSVEAVYNCDLLEKTLKNTNVKLSKWKHFLNYVSKNKVFKT